jgi:hypothetical protein
MQLGWWRGQWVICAPRLLSCRRPTSRHLWLSTAVTSRDVRWKGDWLMHRTPADARLIDVQIVFRSQDQLPCLSTPQDKWWWSVKWVARKTDETSRNCIFFLSLRFIRPEGKIPLRAPRCRWEDNIKMDFREIWWSGWICLRKGTTYWLLWTRKWTFGLHKRLGNPWVPERLAASQRGFDTMGLDVCTRLKIIFLACHCIYTYCSRRRFIIPWYLRRSIFTNVIYCPWV